MTKHVGGGFVSGEELQRVDGGFSRRSFLAMSAIAPFAMSGVGAMALAPASAIPVGLELYSVREGLK